MAGRSRSDACTHTARPRRSSRLRSDADERGFALALVVLLLFAIGVAGATGYQIVLAEATLSVQNSEAQRAFAIARSGLARFVGEQIGLFPDTATYAILGGDAVVVARKVSDIDDYETLYLLTSTGIYSDPSSQSAPARRIVHQYAIHKETPLDWLAAYTQAAGNLRVDSGAWTYGQDISSPSVCPEGGGPDVPAFALGAGSAQFDPTYVVAPQDSIRIGSYQAMVDTLDLNWDLLTDPAFPVDYEDQWPGYIGPDSFPVVRFNANRVGYNWTSGQGVLIVNGDFVPRDGFWWFGVILAKRFRPLSSGGWFSQWFTVYGLVVSGLGDTKKDTHIGPYGRIFYHRCNVVRAGRALGHFRPIGSTWWEEF
ncbi:MAG: hypothetical protein D6701_03890 [Gemmatimonadetes bacterium]|nr:MAG: hypothetical protein D6701_03890 [Gemmatimonadota bacterium]